MEYTEQQKEQLLELSALCKAVPAFEFEGVTFIGYHIDAVKEYIKQNPSDKFFIWLQKNYTVVV